MDKITQATLWSTIETTALYINNNKHSHWSSLILFLIKFKSTTFRFIGNTFSYIRCFAQKKKKNQPIAISSWTTRFFHKINIQFSLSTIFQKIEIIYSCVLTWICMWQRVRNTMLYTTQPFYFSSETQLMDGIHCCLLVRCNNWLGIRDNNSQLR